MIKSRPWAAWPGYCLRFARSMRLCAVVKHGKGGMPGLQTMNAEAIADVTEFLEKSDRAPPGRAFPATR
jgi:hypothetical protein